MRSGTYGGRPAVRAREQMNRQARREQTRRTRGRVPVPVGAPTPDVIFERATDDLRRGDSAAAVSGFTEFLHLQPGHPDALHRLGLAAAQAGQWDEAVQFLDAAIDADPDDAGYHADKGACLLMLDRRAEALAACERAVVLDPDHIGALTKLAELYRENERWDEAAATFRRALVHTPDNHELHAGLGTVLYEQGRLRSSEASLRRALALQPDDPQLHVLLGNTLRLLSRLDETVVAYERALEIEGDAPVTMSNLGVVLAEMTDFAGADAWYQRSLASRDLAQTHFNRSIMLLHLGDTEAGWDAWEYGFASEQRNPNRNPKIERPVWDGSSLANTTIMIWREQGVGDEILFAQCYRDVIAAAKHTIIECDSRFVELFSRSFPGAEVRAQTIDHTYVEQRDPDFDVHLASGSLMRYLRPTVASFPHHDGYIVADPGRVAFFQDWLDSLGAGVKVGMSWRSMLQSAQRRKYYTTLDDWGPVFAVPGTHFINVQYDDCERELIEAEDEFDVKIHRPPELDLFNDLDGCAALSTALDLVIAPNTCVSHMAGAVGTRTWQTTIDFCEAFLGTDSYPWLPSLSTYQRHWDQDWTEVMGHVASDLSALVESERTK